MTKALNRPELAIAADVLGRVELMVSVAAAEVKRSKELVALIDPAATVPLPPKLRNLEEAAITACEDTEHFAENARRQTAFGELATPETILELFRLAKTRRRDER